MFQEDLLVQNSTVAAGYLIVMFLVCVGQHLMATDDFEHRSVSGGLCLYNWVLVGCINIELTLYVDGPLGTMNVATIVRWVVFILGLILFYAPIDIPFYGDADILPVVSCIVLFDTPLLVPECFLLYPMAMLIVIPFYISYWNKTSKTKWKPFTGALLPALPIFYCASVVTIIALSISFIIQFCPVITLTHFVGLNAGSPYFLIMTVAVFFMGGTIDSAIACACWRQKQYAECGGSYGSWLMDWALTRSRCNYCGTPLHWYELIPAVSGFVLGGRCHFCGAKFGLTMPTVELLAGIFSVLVLHNILALNLILGIAMYCLEVLALIVLHRYIL